VSECDREASIMKDTLAHWGGWCVMAGGGGIGGFNLNNGKIFFLFVC